LTNVAITDSTFNDNIGKGVYLEKLGHAVLDGIEVLNSGTSSTEPHAAGIDINLKYGAYEDIAILNSDIIGNGQGDVAYGSGIMIKARDDGGYASTPASLSGLLLRGNNITGNVRGVRFGEPGAGSASLSDVHVNQNDLSGNLMNIALDNQTTNEIDATANWWGAVSGPQTFYGGNPGGAGQFIVVLSGQTNVTFSPWLIDNTDASSDPGLQRPAVLDVYGSSESGANPLWDNISAANNDFRRLANAIATAIDGLTVRLHGTFDWTDATAAAAWANGVDGQSGNDDDYRILANPTEDLTITADAVGDAVIQGPGDLSTRDFETFLEAYGGSFDGLEVSNLTILDFDWSISLFHSDGASYNGLEVLNNRIRMAADSTGDAWHNVGIHYARGQNITIQDNLIEIPGDGLSDTTTDPNSPLYAATAGMQSNTHDGDRYDGLLIDGNTIRILNPMAADPELIYGIWENGWAHDSDIIVSNNVFENLHGDAADNLQRGFRYTSHSGDTTTVQYLNNQVVGANVGMQNYPGTLSNVQPIEMAGNSFTDVAKGIRVLGSGANLHVTDSTFTNTGTMEGVGEALALEGDGTLTVDDSAGAVSISGFGTGILVSGSNATLDVDGANLSGNGIGIDVQGGSATLADVDFAGATSNATDLRIGPGGASVTLVENIDFAGSDFFLDNRSATDFDLTTTAGLNFGGLSDHFRIEDRIYHAVDDTASGLVRLVPGELFVTAPGTGASDEAIQNAIDVADAGDTIRVEAGLYQERIVIDKSISLLGATWDVNKNDPGYAVANDGNWGPVYTETVISNPDGTVQGNVVDIDDVDDVTFAGFVVQALNWDAGGNTQNLVRVNSRDQVVDNLSLINNIIGPNTNITSQPGNAGRMGLYFASPNYSGGDGVTNSLIAGNKIFGAQGNGNNVFLWGSAANYGSPDLADYSGTQIVDNDIYGAHRSGIEIAGGVQGLTIAQNRIHGNASTVDGLPADPALKYGNGILVIRMGSDKTGTDGHMANDLTIADNEIYDNEKNAIYFGPAATNVSLTGNFIYNNGQAAVVVDLDEAYHGASAVGVYDAADNITLYGNSITGNGAGAAVLGTPTNGFVLDASVNWWGTTDESAVAGMMNGEVDFTPYFDSGTDTDTAAGFQGDLSVLRVTDEGSQTGSIGRVQEGINRVSGSTVYVEAGTYNERLNINKQVNLLGAQAGQDARGRSGDESIITESGLSTPNPDLLVEVTAAADGAVIDGFTLHGDPTNTTADTSTLRVWADDIEVRNNVITGMHGVVFKGGDGLLVDQNAFTVNKTGLTGQPGQITNAQVTDNSFAVGASPLSDMSAIYLSSVDGAVISGNEASGFVTRAIGGSNWTNATLSNNVLSGNRDGISIWGNSSWLTVSDNQIANSGQYGINIKAADLGITGNTFDGNAEAAVSIDKHVNATQRVTISGNTWLNTTTGAQVLRGEVDIDETIDGASVAAVRVSGGNVDVSGSFSGNHRAVYADGGNVTVNAATIANSTDRGIYVDGGDLTLTGSTVQDNADGGLIVFGDANVTISDTTFSGNASGQPAGHGYGDVTLYDFTGAASLTGVDIAVDDADYGLQIRGPQVGGGDETPTSYAGTIALDDVEITGDAQRYGMLLQTYLDASSLSFIDVSIDASATYGLAMWDVAGGEIDLGNTTFSNSHDYDLVASLANIDATGAVFLDASGSAMDKTIAANGFAIEDRIGHAVDATDRVYGGGFINFRDGHAYVTPDSYVAPLTDAPSIQRAVNAAGEGWTIHVAPGIYDSQRFTETPGHWSQNDQYAPALVLYKDGQIIQAHDGSGVAGDGVDDVVVQSTHGFWSNSVAIQRATGGLWDGSQYVGAGVNPDGGSAPNAITLVASNVTIDGFTLHRPSISPNVHDDFWNTAAVMIGELALGAAYTQFGDAGGVSGNVITNNYVSDAWHAVLIRDSYDNLVQGNVAELTDTGHWAAMGIGGEASTGVGSTGNQVIDNTFNL
ncbi:MAG: right-handed parallel beta-helix repeat-containing protein, partial [Phycisphaerae bacterium]